MTINKLDKVRVQFADTWLKRLVGLLAHRSLGDNEAMYFCPGGSIHTIGMRFPIDVVYLDHHKKVLKVEVEMRPFRLSFAPKGTCSVLELSAGNVKRTGISLEDTLEFG